jgi:hypothetical protein
LKIIIHLFAERPVGGEAEFVADIFDRIEDAHYYFALFDGFEFDQGGFG